MEDDRTELNDLSSQYHERVASMSKEWFRLAKDVDRLGGRGLAPVSETLRQLSFRKDTSSGSAKGKGKTKKKKKKKKKD